MSLPRIDEIPRSPNPLSHFCSFCWKGDWLKVGSVSATAQKPGNLNENVTQAVTSLLRIKTGVITEEAEMKRLRTGEFYQLSLVIMVLIYKQHYIGSQYSSFADYFPVLLDSLKKTL